MHANRLVGQRRQTHAVPQALLRVVHVVVGDGRVRRHPVVPQRHRALLPLDAHLQVLGVRDVLEQQFQEGVRLFVLEADDPLREPGVDIERLLPGRRVHAHHRVLRLDRLAPHVLAVAPGIFGLREPAVLRAQALEQRADRRRQALVGGRGRGPGGVAADGRDAQQSQDGDAGRLVLVRDVRVVARGGQPVVTLARAVLVVRAQVNVVELEVVLDVGADGVDVQRAKVAGKFLLGVDAGVLEVLVAEDDDAALGNEQGELVLLQVGEGGQLEATDLGTNGRGEAGGGDTGRRVGGQQVGLGLVGDETTVVEGKGLERWEGGFFVVDGEVRSVLVLKGEEGLC